MVPELPHGPDWSMIIDELEAFQKRMRSRKSSLGLALPLVTKRMKSGRLGTVMWRENYCFALFLQR